MQEKEENSWNVSELEVNLARESGRSENKSVKTTREELSVDTLQEAYRRRVVIQDIALRWESPALQLPGQCKGHQPAVTFPAMLWQGVAMAHGGKLVSDSPRDWVPLLITDTHTGEAGDEVGEVPQTLLIATPRPSPIEEVSIGSAQVGQSRGRAHSRGSNTGGNRSSGSCDYEQPLLFLH